MKRSILAVAAVVLVAQAPPVRGDSSFPTGFSPLLALERPTPVEMAQIGAPPRSTDKPEEPRPADKGELSPRRAMLYSLILPGLGQQYAGRDERARVFYAIEAGAWGSYLAFRLQGNARRDRYIQYAEFYGAVDPSGKNDDYWLTISQFERSDPGPGSANEYVRRQARAFFPDDLASQQEYFAKNGYFGNRTWDWQSPDKLSRYRELRSKSIDSYNRSHFSIAFAIANRLISMIDAARVASATNRDRAAERSATGALHGRFGFKMVTQAGERIPVLTYKATF